MVKLITSLTILIVAISQPVFAQSQRAPTKKVPTLKAGSKHAIMALKVKNPTLYMWNDNKEIINQDAGSFSLTFIETNLEKKKFKSAGAYFELSQTNGGYLFVKVRARPHSLKVAGRQETNEVGLGPRICFHDDTFYFPVQAGSVNFVGTVNQKQIAENIEYAVINEPKKSKWVGNFFVGKNVKRPPIIAPSKYEVDLLRKYLDEFQPKINGEIVPVLDKKPIIIKRRHAITKEFTCT